MNFETGRAAKAAALHSMTVAPTHNNNDCNDNDYDTGSFADWQSVRRAANDQRGGDRWKSRGVDGIWHRWHTSPRVSLFTPYRVAKGPASSIGLHQHRFTYGVTSAGRTFEFHDDWTKPERAHMVLDEPWLGYTVFTERGAELTKTQDKRPRTAATTSQGSPGTGSPRSESARVSLSDAEPSARRPRMAAMTTSASTSRWADA